MEVNLVVAPDAAADVDLAFNWYESQRVGLGREFVSRFRACVEMLRQSPEAHAVLTGTYRRALLRKFPYAVFYEFLGDTVTVHAVLHTARDPTIWKTRLR